MGRQIFANRYNALLPQRFASAMPSYEIDTDPNGQRPDTPCVGVCSTTFDETCRGCGRTVVEVANWVFMTAGEKEVVWKRIVMQGYPKRQG